jgi:enoyl-CoA hydratase/carnithine racemase
MAEDEILIEYPAPGMTRILLNRPQRMNALGYGMTLQLRQAVQRIGDSDARVLMLRGAGRGFCAGADLKERRDMNADRRAAHNAAINEFVDMLARLPIPTIAVINGTALGGGCEIALACDFRLIAEDARIGLTETRIGVIPGAGGTQRLPRLIGAARALELMMTGEPVDARRAVSIGLANEVLPAEGLDARALALAQLLSTRSPLGLRVLKTLVYQGLEKSLEEGLRLERTQLKQLLDSADYAEGLAAFAEKRPPKFIGA